MKRGGEDQKKGRIWYCDMWKVEVSKEDCKSLVEERRRRRRIQI